MRWEIVIQHFSISLMYFNTKLAPFPPPYDVAEWLRCWTLVPDVFVTHGPGSNPVPAVYLFLLIAL